MSIEDMIERLEILSEDKKIKPGYAESCIDFLREVEHKEYEELTHRQANWFDDIEEMIEEHFEDDEI